MTDKLTIGFIPLVDAASLLVAKDFGFAEAENLDLQLVREVSWANIREKLTAGIFDSAHMLAPMAVASALDVVPGSVPFRAPFVLALNGNAITVSLELYDDIAGGLKGEDPNPLSTAIALRRIVERRKEEGRLPLTFGSTFPFSGHTYQLRSWMEAAGINTADDVRIVTLPPSTMVESLSSGDVDGFCVGAPWNSVAVEQGIGHILHFGCEIVPDLIEKVLAMRKSWADLNQNLIVPLLRSVNAAAQFVREPANLAACCERLAARDRIDCDPELIRRSLTGVLKVAPDGTTKEDGRYLILGEGRLARPETKQAAWLYSQMTRWRQTLEHPDLTEAANAVLSPEIFDRTFPAPPLH